MPAPKPEELNQEQKHALAMNGYYDMDGDKFKKVPDQVSKDGHMAYDLGKTVLIIYPEGGVAVMSKQMNLPKGVKV